MDAELEDVKHWVCLYPAYINGKRTKAEGRRIPKEKCIENPTSQEIWDILKNAGLNVKLENRKMYPRDQNRDYQFQGRVRIELKDKEGQLLNPQFNNRDSLMYFAAEMIPKLKGRQIKTTSNDSGATQQKTGQKKKKK